MSSAVACVVSLGDSSSTEGAIVSVSQCGEAEAELVLQCEQYQVGGEREGERLTLRLAIRLSARDVIDGSDSDNSNNGHSSNIDTYGGSGVALSVSGEGERERALRGVLLVSQRALSVPSASVFFEAFSLSFAAHNFASLWRRLPVCIIAHRARAGVRAIDARQFYGNRTPSAPVHSHTLLTAHRSEEREREKERVFDAFARQELAFARFDALAASQRARCKVFSFESVQSGKRRFLVAEVSLFCEEYFAMESEKRHAYEIVREASPGRLYLDLEFSRRSNADVDGDALTDRWLRLVLWKLFSLFDIALSRCDVLLLDSTTSEKYSKHAIVLCRERDPDTQKERELLFADNREMGCVLRALLWDLSLPAEEHTCWDCVFAIDGHLRTPRKEFADFWVNPMPSTSNEGDRITQREEQTEAQTATEREKERKTLFVDMGVYSRNRAFRLFGSCKFGKSKALSLCAADRLRGYYSLSRTGSAKERDARALQTALLLDSFVIPADLFLPETHPCSNAEREGKRARNETSTAGIQQRIEEQSLALNKEKYALLPSMRAVSVRASINALRQHCGGGALSLHRSSLPDSYRRDPSHTLTAKQLTAHSEWAQRLVAQSQHAQQSSWFPSLDAFVAQFVASRGGVVGTLTHWALYTQRGGDFPVYGLRYQIGRNRFCANVGRMHRSNGIFVEVNLMERELHQACWDPDCRGFRSASMTVPANILPAPEDIADMVKTFLQQKKERAVADESF